MAGVTEFEVEMLRLARQYEEDKIGMEMSFFVCDKNGYRRKMWSSLQSIIDLARIKQGFIKDGE
jgi:hypothetical protein